MPLALQRLHRRRPGLIATWKGAHAKVVQWTEGNVYSLLQHKIVQIFSPEDLIVALRHQQERFVGRICFRTLTDGFCGTGRSTLKTKGCVQWLHHLDVVARQHWSDSHHFYFLTSFALVVLSWEDFCTRVCGEREREKRQSSHLTRKLRTFHFCDCCLACALVHWKTSSTTVFALSHHVDWCLPSGLSGHAPDQPLAACR